MSVATRFLPFALVAAVALAVVLIATGGGDGYVVNARFKDAGGILKNYGVKIGGVPAGKVSKITLLSGDVVNVEMTMKQDGAPIGAGATAKVRPVNLLGEKYVDLDPGDLSTPQPSGGVIPESRTAVPTEIDDVLNVLDPDTRSALRILINESGLAVAGRGANFNQTLSDLPPALDQARRVVSQVAAENGRLNTLLVNGDRVIHSMTERRDQLGDLVDSAGRALQTIAERRQELGATVDNAPEALSKLRATLTALDTASTQLTPAADDLATATPSLASTLTRLPRFADDANTTLAEVKAVSPTLSRLGRQSTPTLKRLRPTAAYLAQYARDSDPMVRGLGRGDTLKSLYQFMDDWAHVTDNKDGLSHVFRLRFSFNKDLVGTALAKYGRLIGAIPKRHKTTHRARKPHVPLPKVADAAKPVTKLLPKVAGRLGDKVTKAIDDVAATVDTLVGKVGKVVDKVTGGATRPDRGDDVTKLINYLLAP